MVESSFFNKLFNEGEGICYGSLYETKVSWDFPKEYYYFFSINPLHPLKDFGADASPKYNEDVPRRADINVTEFRSFLFEMDFLSIDEQRKLLEASGIDFTSIVFSGGKSLHAILSLEKPLEVPAHNMVGISSYKQIWRRLRAYLDGVALELGFELPEGAESFIDGACQNCSRLSRFPNAIREGGYLQELLHLGSRIKDEEFDALLAKCPQVEKVGASVKNSVDFITDDAREFMFLCDKDKDLKGLKNSLKYSSSWASSSNMYPKMYAFACWAIDYSGVTKDAYIEALWKWGTFDKLLEVGYPKEKLYVGIDHAFNFKRRAK